MYNCLIWLLRKHELEGGKAWHRLKPELFPLLSFPGLPSRPAAPTGLGDYMKRYEEGIRRVLDSFGPVPEFSGESAKSVVKVSLELRAQPELHCSCIFTITI